MHLFQSVLGEVIDEFNSYFEGLQGKKRFAALNDLQRPFNNQNELL